MDIKEFDFNVDGRKTKFLLTHTYLLIKFEFILLYFVIKRRSFDRLLNFDFIEDRSGGKIYVTQCCIYLPYSIVTFFSFFDSVIHRSIVVIARGFLLIHL